MEEHTHICPLCKEKWICHDPNCEYVIEEDPLALDETCEGCHMAIADQELKAYEESLPYIYLEECL